MGYTEASSGSSWVAFGGNAQLPHRETMDRSYELGEEIRCALYEMNLESTDSS